MNLICDPWIPVRLKDGGNRVIRPHEMADDDIAAPNWARVDLNVACLELLIGIVFMADPPADKKDWQARQKPDQKRLELKLSKFASAFNLDGDGPRFLQDLEKLEGEANAPDMLFIDSAGANTAKNNADVMVRRDRYDTLPPPLAAMALFAFQDFAPSGGAGNRTSMRGGGPMTTLIDPGTGLWSLIWANVPYGNAAAVAELPWMRPTQVSDGNKPPTSPKDARQVTVEMFFGMPRRLRLIFNYTGDVEGVIQRPYGTNYTNWIHPLSPYYRLKEGSELLPVHPKPGQLSYRNWLGIVSSEHKSDKGLRQRAACVEQWLDAAPNGADARLLVAGWAMDNMKPLDFTYSAQPLLALSKDQEFVLAELISAAEIFAIAVRAALEPTLGAGEVREVAREQFYAETQAMLEQCQTCLGAGEEPAGIAKDWLHHMQRVATDIFNAASLPGLSNRKPEKIEDILAASDTLRATFGGFTKSGSEAYERLGLPRPEILKKKSKAREAA